MAGGADGVGAPPPTTVWMVHKGTGKQGVRGELSLEPERLIFRPEIVGGKLDLLGQTVFALTEIRGAGKSKGSPVLKLDVSTPGLPKVVLFYFTKPPDMYSSPMPNPRIATMTYLMRSDAYVGQEVDVWLKALRAVRGK